MKPKTANRGEKIQAGPREQAAIYNQQNNLTVLPLNSVLNCNDLIRMSLCNYC